MGKNQKKKGKGAEKTAAKTDKKLSQKMKKQLAASGEVGCYLTDKVRIVLRSNLTS